MTTNFDGNPTAVIEVRDETGELRADVYVEVYDGVPRVVLTTGIVERDSDDVSAIFNLLTGESLPT